jgi:hypothetical protein
MYAAPTLGEAVAPKSTTAARKLADYDAPFGRRAAIQKELERVEAFGGWEIAPESMVREAQRSFPDRVSIGHIVGVLRLKTDPDGDPRAPEILNKFRVALGDPTFKFLDIQTYSSTADSMSYSPLPRFPPPSTPNRRPSISAARIGMAGASPSSTAAAFCVVPAWLDGFIGKISGTTYRTHPRRWFSCHR